MTHWGSGGRDDETARDNESREVMQRIIPDGGRESDEEEDATKEVNADQNEEEDASTEGTSTEDTPTEDKTTEDSSNVEVRAEGKVGPAKPTWEEPDLDDIPEVDGPKTRPAESSGHTDTEQSATRASTGGDVGADSGSEGTGGEDPTAGMPNTARSPKQSRLKEAGLEGYIVALELSARLPEDLRLPEEAEDLVPVAFEAELEQDIQAFAADQFDNPSPHVETLDFVEVDGELWLRLRLGIDPGSFADLDPEAIQEHALQQVDRLM